MRSRPLRAFLLGFGQGLAELLPVSSSTHSALLGARLVGEEGKGHTLQVALHAASGAALAGRLRGRLAVPLPALAPAVLLPAALGLLLDRRYARQEGSGRRAALFGLAFGSAVMAAGGLAGEGRREAGEAGFLDGLCLGLAGAAALAPGVSRSGTALAVARLRGFSAGGASRLAWACGLPLMVGAGALRLVRAARSGELPPLPLLAWASFGAYLGTVVGACAGLQRVAARRLLAFASYRLAVAGALLARERARSQSLASSSG